ncbi:Os02g0436500 [Oryza sativa Japonica Group]|uniref:Os02g0436500 protein n=1 Tax=Oryza sativa subsp. japonica TaxID=39947 RepID=A0A0P0VII4_ORYSJ|nr:hypothetical protein EE612_010973 [Oryza sativa]BAS78463.1 Os02g0436500 [Oryza sativa Japonica Group]
MRRASAQGGTAASRSGAQGQRRRPAAGAAGAKAADGLARGPTACPHDSNCVGNNILPLGASAVEEGAECIASCAASLMVHFVD